MSTPTPPPTKPRPPVLPRSTVPGTGSPTNGPSSTPVVVDDLRSELQAWFELSPHGMMVFDEHGAVLRHNAPLVAMIGKPPAHLREASAEVRLMLGWPSQLPAVGAQRVEDGWLPDPEGEPLRVRVKVRGVPVLSGARLVATAAAGQGVRWIALFEDHRTEDERDIARVEINALMGTAGIGVATWDHVRGWVSSVQRGARTAAPTGAAEAGLPGAANPPLQGSLMAVGRDLVEPESMAEYDSLQAALRQHVRTEVRYAVRHKDSGRRWLMTRVEPALIGPQRGAVSVVTVDVTEEEVARRRNQALLTELSTILDVSPAGIAYLRNGQVVRCNHRFEGLLQVPHSRNRQVDAVLREAGVDGEAIGQVMQALRSDAALETEIFLPSGPQRVLPLWCSLALRRTAEPVSGEAGDAGVVVVLADATRLKAQQSELEALARERELMFNLSEVGIVYQKDGHIERANQAMADLTARPRGSLQGLALAALYESERTAAHYAELEQRDLALLGRSRGERRVRRADGSVFWAQVSQRPVEPERPTAGTILSFVNIDEGRRAQESLLQQADRTRAILDSVLVGIVTVGETGIEWMNRSARRMFGGELADFEGAPIAEVATDEPDHPLRRTDYVTTLEEGQAETFECRLRARDGRTFFVVGNVVVTGRDTDHRQLTYALLDIERRRQAEISIAQARASLQRIIETAPLALALFDSESQQVVQANQMLATFAAKPLDEIVGRVPTQWLHGPEGAKLAGDLHRALTAQGSVQRELRRGSEETLKVWDIRIVALAAGADAPEQLLMVASDVTAQRNADEARLAAAITQREMLIKEVHHRIKNNLQGVAGLLQQSASRHPEAAGAIAEAVGQVHAIAQVHGLQVGVTGPMRVRGVVEAIATSVQRMFGHPIHVEVSGPAPHRFALSEADSIPIALTVNELLTNAIKHSPAAGSDAALAAQPLRPGAPACEIQCHVHCEPQSLDIRIRNQGALRPGFALSDIPPGVSGLGLVRSLLPRKGARLTLTPAEGGGVEAILHLEPPAVQLLEPL